MCGISIVSCRGDVLPLPVFKVGTYVNEVSTMFHRAAHAAFLLGKCFEAFCERGAEPVDFNEKCARGVTLTIKKPRAYDGQRLQRVRWCCNDRASNIKKTGFFCVSVCSWVPLGQGAPIVHDE